MTDFIDLGWSAERAKNGILAGLVGGIVFGLMLQMLDMMTTVGTVIGTENQALTWIYHLFNSAVFGLILALVARPMSYGVGAVDGLVWGFILWIVAGTLLLRTLLGRPIAFSDQPAMMSLVGHLAYGLVAGLTLTWLNRRAAAEERAPARAAA